VIQPEERCEGPGFSRRYGHQQLPVDPLTGEEAEAIVAKMMKAPPAVLAKAKAIYEGRGDLAPNCGPDPRQGLKHFSVAGIFRALKK
jgi:hypothetical protein